MTRLVYIPVFKVGVAYVVRQGRAWTALEHALLYCLAKSPLSIDELERLSDMPVRLVIQALLELMGAGWVALSVQTRAVKFAATEEGIRVAERTYLPAHTNSLRRSDTLCLDRLVGSTLDPDDLTLVHREKIPLDATILPARTFKPELHPSDSIERLYMEENESFHEWVDHRLHSLSFCALVRVSGDTIQGLPDYAPMSLRQAIIEEASVLGTADDAEPIADVARYQPTRSYQTQVVAEDLIVGGEAHRLVLDQVLKNARTTVVIHSCFVSKKTINQLMPALASAAERGVIVDLLWGLRYADATEWAKAGVLAAQAAIARLPEKIRHKIRFSETESGSHAKLIIADSGPQGKFEGFLGSCNWLSSDFDWTELSLRIRDPRPLAHLAGLMATLRVPSYGEWGGDVHRLVRLKKRLSEQRPLTGPVRLDLLIDREHLALVRHARDNAKCRVVSGCDLFGPAGETSVFVPMRTAASGDIQVELLFNRPTDSMPAERVQKAKDQLTSQGVRLHETAPDFHAKFLLWDDVSVCISSYNWLATTPDRWKPDAAEIGVYLEGGALTDVLLSSLKLPVSA